MRSPRPCARSPASPSRKQLEYNREHNITPATIVKAIDASLVEMYSPEWAVVPEIDESPQEAEEYVAPHELSERISGLRREMMEAAEELEYERAAQLRDQIKRLEMRALGIDTKGPASMRPPANGAAAPARPRAGADAARAAPAPKTTRAGPGTGTTIPGRGV